MPPGQEPLPPGQIAGRVVRKSRRKEKESAELKTLKIQLLGAAFIALGVLGGVLCVALQVFLNTAATPEVTANLQDKVVTPDRYHFMFMLIPCGGLVAFGVLFLMLGQTPRKRREIPPAHPPQADQGEATRK